MNKQSGSWGKIDDVGTLRIIAAGAFGGIVASYVMNQAQRALKELQKKREPKQDQFAAEEASDENATVKAAASVAHAVGAGPIPDEKKATAGNAIHYGVGAALGAFYGGVASKAPGITMGYGIAYGGAAWLFGDETAVPALGFAPSSNPLSTHLNALAAHCIYGFATDLVMRGLIKRYVLNAPA